MKPPTNENNTKFRVKVKTARVHGHAGPAVGAGDLGDVVHRLARMEADRGVLVAEAPRHRPPGKPWLGGTNGDLSVCTLILKIEKWAITCSTRICGGLVIPLDITGCEMGVPTRESRCPHPLIGTWDQPNTNSPVPRYITSLSRPATPKGRTFGGGGDHLGSHRKHKE